jgi:hypothetical protein
VILENQISYRNVIIKELSLFRHLDSNSEGLEIRRPNHLHVHVEEGGSSYWKRAKEYSIEKGSPETDT